MWYTIIYSFVFLQINLSVSDTQKLSTAVSVTRNEKEVLVNTRVNGLFTNDIIEGINRGFTSYVEYSVDIWCDKVLWLKQLVQRKKFGFYISYDLWTREYKVRDIYGEVTSVNDFEAVLNKVCIQNDISICPVKVLNNSKTYYVVVKTMLKPVLTENLNDIVSYTRGEIEQVKKKENSNLFLHLLEQAKDIAGLGDRVIIGKSEVFKRE
ncbi:MAG: DUF4390 domain-containing protein [bacterium]